MPRAQRTRRIGRAAIGALVAAFLAISPAPSSAELGDPGPFPFGWHVSALWELDGPVVGSPAVSTWGPLRLDTWVIGGDHAVWHHVATPEATGWEHLGGASMSGPAAVSWGFERADVFVTGLDGALWQRTFDHGWSPWVSLGGQLVDSPAVTSGAQGQLDVFGPGIDGATWHRSFRGGAWGPWHSLGGLTSDAPAATSWNEERLDVFVRGIDGALWHRYAVADQWQPWSSLGGVLVDGPAATELVEHHLRPGERLAEVLWVFVVAPDGFQYWRSFVGGSTSTPGWSQWTQGGVPADHRTALVALNTTQVVLAGPVADGSLLQYQVGDGTALQWLP